MIVAADIAAFYRVWLGHMPFAEDPRAFLDAIQPFLERVSVHNTSDAASAA